MAIVGGPEVPSTRGLFRYPQQVVYRGLSIRSKYERVLYN